MRFVILYRRQRDAKAIGQAGDEQYAHGAASSGETFCRLNPHKSFHSLPENLGFGHLRPGHLDSR